MPSESDERSPLLAAAAEPENESETEQNEATESSPLLAARKSTSPGPAERDSNAPSGQPPRDETGVRRKRRWPSFIAMLVMASLVVAIMVLGFVVPPAVQQYIENAVVLEPTDLSVESLTAEGIRARVKGTFRLDGSRVADENARRIGRIATSIMRQIGTEETKLRLHLPHYGNALIGSALLPPITLHLVDGTVTELDFVTEFAPGDTETARQVVNDWLKGNLQQLKVTGATAVGLKSGIIPLGTHDVTESMVFEAKDLPPMPEYTINNLVFHDVPVGDGGQMGVGANVSVTAYNRLPVGLTVPSLGFEVLVANCDASQPNIRVASAVSSTIEIHPRSNVTVEAQGTIRELPASLTKACPSSELSPLDNLMKRYLNGQDAEVFVHGKASGSGGLPDWIGSLIESITVPIQFPGRSLDGFLREFALEDVDFKLPSPFADPGRPDSKPRVSGTVRVLAAIPADLNINVSVSSLRASGDLVFRGSKFGELRVDEWQKATSSIVHKPGNEEDFLSVTSRIRDAPIDILDSDTFSEILQELLLGGKDIMLDVRATVDVKVSTVLGDVVIRGVPATGKVPVKHVPGDTLAALNPQVGEVRVLSTSKTGVHIEASVNMTNPTPYTAWIPYMSIHMTKNQHLLGEAVAKEMRLGRGDNSNLVVQATWDPESLGGPPARAAARRLLSSYLSGKNTTVTLRAHRASVPACPAVGEALSRLNVTLSTPRLKLPGDADGDAGRGFVRDATFHILSSTATFTLASPLGRDTVHVERINATAFFNHTEPVGRILHDEPFDVPPGLSRTPRLPVDWSADRVGFGKLRDALGGTLKLDAVADVTVRLGRWVEQVNYEGEGIGARVSL